MRNIIVSALLLWAACALAQSCAGLGGRPSPAVGTGGPRAADLSTGGPRAADLQSILAAELTRLGKSAKTAASVPSGTSNAAFDLTASVIDPDGPPDGGSGGMLPPTGIMLIWTERSLGDYDQNGQVNAADLAPLGMHWQATVAYVSPALHGGIAFWPSGDPADGANGAANWRLARMDGNGDGVLDAKDVTAIAQHWMEYSAGYRIYRKGPGESDFTMLPGIDADDQLTLTRPASAPTNAPVRLIFTDTPLLAGHYEYYVAAFAPVKDNSSGGEGPVSSTVAVDYTGGGYLDISPPVWQGSPGITAATPGTDGTVTVTWGTAVDNAVPPAPATPPVSYSVYYSTQTPIDYENAAYYRDITSPWISPALLSGQIYYFAVRARDSATPPNEDANTTEAQAVASGGPVYLDYFVPEWTDYHNGHQLVGISQVAAEDGRLVIEHTKAMDIHSPPVHYDLWYASAREAPSLTDSSGIPDPLAHVIHDIPPKYTLEWENRHPVYLQVTAHDSSPTENNCGLASGNAAVWIAPGRAEKIPIDMSFPGRDTPEFKEFSSDSVTDITAKRIYICYMPLCEGSNPNAYATELWFLVMDAMTGQWQAERIYTAKWNSLEAYTAPKISRSPTGEIWAFCREFDGVDWQHAGNYYGRFFVRHKNEDWEQWSPPGVPTAWDEQFDHNGNPAFFEFHDSDTTPNRIKLIYKWWDANSQVWVREEVSDPGAASGITFLRPDGVLQLVSPSDGVPLGDTGPRYFRINERTLEGVWTQVLSGVGYVAGEDHGNRVETWDQQWAWSLSGTADEVGGVLVYGLGTGYQFLPVPDFFALYGTSWRAWPASGGLHLLPDAVFTGGKLVCQQLIYSNFCKTAPARPSVVSGGYFDPIANYYSGTCLDYDFALRKWQLYLYRCPADETLY